jgi:hypothetical protein
MPLITYIPKTFSEDHTLVIDRATAIAREYARTGDDLTLRQLYYQFVARDFVPNKTTEYKRLGSILNDARLAGEFDWSYLTDITRNLRGGDGGNEEPIEVIDPNAFYVEGWKGQPHRVEVWVEKDALVRVIGRAAQPERVAYFSCRGYTSSSELWSAAQRIERVLDTDDVEDMTILHLGDHDPSGIDMTRDIRTRLELFLDGDGYDIDRLTIERIALNMDQVRRYNPPPNPAKETDSRHTGYEARFGSSSWELDALDPPTLRALIREHIRALRNEALWEGQLRIERKGEAVLEAIREHYTDVVAYLDEHGWAAATDDDDETEDDDDD